MPTCAKSSITLSRRKLRVLVWNKIHRHRINTVPCVFFGEVLAREDVSKVGAAVDALDFRSPSIRVRQSFYSPWNFVVKAWPSAVCFKLVLRTVQFCSAVFANVGAFFPKRVVFACEGHFGAFMNYDLFFFRAEFLKICLRLRSRQQNTTTTMCLEHKKVFCSFKATCKALDKK